MPRALITGVNGQDGSYLAELLISKGYEVVGTTSGTRTNREYFSPKDKIEIIETNLQDRSTFEDILRDRKPDEVYNFAARASSTDLWSQPAMTGELNGLTVARILEAILKVNSKIRFVQASSSEVFGNAVEVPQTEQTPFCPRNPYGVAKAYGHWITVVYREQRGLFASSAILYNHESPRRGLEFVTRKISRTVARIKLGLTKDLRLGNIAAQRDWGFAADYVQAMWLMLQQSTPDDYIIASGQAHSVRELCEIAFSHVGLNYEDYVMQDPENFRESETALLVGNPAKARQVLGWRPTLTFADLVRLMVDADLRSMQHSRPEVPAPADEAYRTS
jgi:GDPmannose 4,6-dehydratase